jgi:hypothetical protein
MSRSESMKQISIAQIEKIADEIIKGFANGEDEKINTTVRSVVMLFEKRAKEAVNGKD